MTSHDRDMGWYRKKEEALDNRSGHDPRTEHCHPTGGPDGLSGDSPHGLVGGAGKQVPGPSSHRHCRLEKTGEQTLDGLRLFGLENRPAELGQDLVFAEDGRLETCRNPEQTSDGSITLAYLGLDVIREVAEQGVERVIQGGLWSGNRDQYTKTCGKHEAVIESAGSGQ